MRAACGVVVKLSSPVWGRARQIIVDLNIYNFNNSLTGLQQQQLAVNMTRLHHSSFFFSDRNSKSEFHNMSDVNVIW